MTPDYNTWEEWDYDEYDSAKYAHVQAEMEKHIDLESDRLTDSDYKSAWEAADSSFPTYEQWIAENDARLSAMYHARPLRTTRHP